MPRQRRGDALQDTANRIFVALRNETRAHSNCNDNILQLLRLSDTLATAIVAGTGHARETHIVARACALLDAHRAATGDLRIAIARVGASLDDLLR
jgi:hypothetical protein